MPENWIDNEVHQLEKEHRKNNEEDNQKLIKIIVMLFIITLLTYGV